MRTEWSATRCERECSCCRCQRCLFVCGLPATVPTCADTSRLATNLDLEPSLQLVLPPDQARKGHCSDGGGGPGLGGHKGWQLLRTCDFPRSQGCNMRECTGKQPALTARCCHAILSCTEKDRDVIVAAFHFGKRVTVRCREGAVSSQDAGLPNHCPPRSGGRQAQHRCSSMPTLPLGWRPVAREQSRSTNPARALCAANAAHPKQNAGPKQRRGELGRRARPFSLDPSRSLGRVQVKAL